MSVRVELRAPLSCAYIKPWGNMYIDQNSPENQKFQCRTADAAEHSTAVGTSTQYPPYTAQERRRKHTQRERSG